MNFSYWENRTFFENIDILVVGSGIVGLSTAIEIKKIKPKLNVTILERGALPLGASTRNAGFACFGSCSELLEDLGSMSEDEVFQLVEKRWKGLLNLRSLVGDSTMNYTQCGGIELFRDSDHLNYEACASRIDYLNTHLKSITGAAPFSISPEKSDGFRGLPYAIFNHLEGAVDTGKMMRALLQLASQLGVQILNGLHADGFEIFKDHVAVNINGNKIKTAKLGICTNGFAQSLLPQTEVFPARNQVIVTAPIKNLKVKGTYHLDAGYIYFRNVEDRLLIGGFRHTDKAGEATSEMAETPQIQSAIKNFIDTHILPETPYSIDYSWSGIMGVGASKAVVLKQIDDKVFCGVRMGGMGVAIGTLIGKDLAKMILEE